MKSWLKWGLIAGIITLIIYIILAIINVTSLTYMCEPSGNVPISRWLYPYPLDRWITKYSGCSLQSNDLIYSGII